MKKINFKTIYKTKMADTVTPVGLYLRFRDRFANTLLLESSDYHSKEESYSFLAIDPIVSMKVDANLFTVSHKGTQIESHKISRNFYELFDKFTNSIRNRNLRKRPCKIQIRSRLARLRSCGRSH